MLLPFLHQRMRVTEQLLTRSNEVLAKYVDGDLDLQPALMQFLGEAATGYRQLGLATAENEMRVLEGECVSAAQGVHPLTLERVTTRRRELARAIALRALQRSAERLRSDLERDTSVLANVTTQLRPMLLAAIQKGLHTDPANGPSRNKAPLLPERLWKAMLADPDLQLAARQVAMQVGVHDIHLLLQDLIEAAGVGG